MPELDSANQQNQNSRSVANIQNEESSEGVSLMPPPLQFDGPPVQMSGGNDTVGVGSNQAESDFQQGSRYFNIGNYQRAMVFFQRSLHGEGLDEETSAELMYNMGLCNYHLDRFPAAINYFEIYLTQNPGNETAERYLREARYRANASNADGEITGENQHATQEGGILNEDRPDQSTVNDNSQQLLQRAQRQFNNGDYRSASYLYEQLRQGSNLSASDNADILYNLGMCYYRMNRFATSITYFQQYLRQNPGNEEAERHLREAQRRTGI